MANTEGIFREYIGGAVGLEEDSCPLWLESGRALQPGMSVFGQKRT
jgi:hypothetical protein